MKPIKACVLGLLLLLSFPLSSLSFDDPGDPWELALRLTEAMSDEQALAQTFMLAWIGAEPSPLILEWIRERNIGGVKIFGWNTEDSLRLAQTVGELQTAARATQFGVPLLVATDQEGGIVRHVKGGTSETPGNMAIGASGRPADAYWAGYYIAQEIALLGVNMNFAPTVDLFTDRNSVLIGPRSFGDDPLQAGILGAAFMRGQQETGMIPTAKHFPGHGATALDSHGVLPIIDADLDLLWERELVPYRHLVAEGVPVIMSGHLAFPNTPGGRTPASLSRWFLTELLRGQMGYEGLIITDDLMMIGATVYTGSLSRAAKQAIEAGNDIIMFSQTPHLNDAIWTFLLASMQSEEDFRERVRDACRRILTLKLEQLQGDGVPLIPDLARVDQGLLDPQGSAFFLSLAARSVTVTHNEGGLIPLQGEEAGRILLVGNFTDFINYGRRAFPGAASYWYGTTASGPSAALLNQARNADTIIVSVSGPGGLRILEGLRPLGKKVIVFSVLSPVFLEDLDWVDGALAVYSYAPESFIAGFSVLLGRIESQGRLPFSVQGL